MYPTVEEVMVAQDAYLESFQSLSNWHNLVTALEFYHRLVENSDGGEHEWSDVGILDVFDFEVAQIEERGYGNGGGDGLQVGDYGDGLDGSNGNGSGPSFWEYQAGFGYGTGQADGNGKSNSAVGMRYYFIEFVRWVHVEFCFGMQYPFRP